jgi:AraC-like DNA-binding protein/mannose-6-phosphate isomerase-like protein (cupin superfamily)
MENYDLIIAELQKYNEDELFYKEYYFAKQSQEEMEKFLLRHSTEEVLDRHLICPELYAPADSIHREERFFKLENNRNIWLEKHNRYSPLYLHSHEYFEIFYVFSGSCTHSINGQTQYLEEGTLCLIAPYVEHSIGVFDDSIVLNIMIQRSTFDDIFFNDLRAHNFLSNFFLSNIYTTSKISSLSFHIADDELVELLLSMLLEETVDDSYTYRILNHQISIFFTRLVRKYGKAKADYTAESALNETAMKMISYINDHYRNITLSQLADHFNYTDAHCSRLIKSITSHNFTELLRNVRLRRAESLLLSSPNSVEEISYMVGYENAATFIRLFKQHYHMTPGKFRQNGKSSIF